MALYRAIMTVAGMTAFSRVLGFLRDMLIAAALGASPAADAFFVAFRIPNLFRRLFAEGAFDSAFVPLFAKRLHGEGKAEAKIFAEQTLSGLTAILLAITVLAEIAMPWLMLGLAPGFVPDPQKFHLAIWLARIALPYLACMSVVALYAGMLNSMSRYAAAAFAPTLLNVVLILVLLGTIVFGITPDRPHVAHILAWAVTGSGILQMLVLIVAAARAGIRLSLVRPVWNDKMRSLTRLAWPGLIAGGIAQLSMIIGTIVASMEERAVSWLYYADRIFQLPLGVIGVAVGVVLLPELSRRLRAGDHAAAMETENRSLEFALFLTMPAALALILVAGPIIQVLFQHGAFTAIDSRASAQMLVALALGLPPYVLVKVFNPGFFAREDTKTPMLCAGHALAINAVLSVVLFVLLGVVGIAFATTIAGWVNAVLLARALRRRGDLTLDETFRRRFLGICAASLVMGAALLGLKHLLGGFFWPQNGIVVQVASLSLLVGAGLAVYFVCAEFFGAMTLRRALKNLKAS